MRRHPFAAVNLISDPVHGYIELTKRLTASESSAAGLPAEEVAEEDSTSTLDVLKWVSLAVLVVALVLGGIGLRERRKVGRS